MLYHFSHYVKNILPIFNSIEYSGVRALAGFLSSLILSFTFGNSFIDKSRKFFRSKTREWTPERHKEKGEMPTMGGLFILGIVIINALIWCNLLKIQVWIFLFTLIGFGAIGFWDDWCKIRYKKGVSARYKILFQLSMAALVALVLIYGQGIATTIGVPFLNLKLAIGFFFIPWVLFIIVGSSNAVNLTDGLDGLALGSLIPNVIIFSLICYMASNQELAQYVHIPHADCSEITVLGGILVGSLLGFLWYNAYPAQIFMGDVGSLALGAGLALMAIMTKQELLLPITGGIFVLETVSVMIQVISYRRFGKRIFKMAPIHHHFELLGWHESKITARFTIISIIICMSTLLLVLIKPILSTK